MPLITLPILLMSTLRPLGRPVVVAVYVVVVVHGDAGAPLLGRFGSGHDVVMLVRVRVEHQL